MSRRGQEAGVNDAPLDPTLPRAFEPLYIEPNHATLGDPAKKQVHRVVPRRVRRCSSEPIPRMAFQCKHPLLAWMLIVRHGETMFQWTPSVRAPLRVWPVHKVQQHDGGGAQDGRRKRTNCVLTPATGTNPYAQSDITVMSIKQTLPVQAPHLVIARCGRSRFNLDQRWTLQRYGECSESAWRGAQRELRTPARLVSAAPALLLELRNWLPGVIFKHAEGFDHVLPMSAISGQI